MRREDGVEKALPVRVQEGAYQMRLWITWLLLQFVPQDRLWGVLCWLRAHRSLVVRPTDRAKVEVPKRFTALLRRGAHNGAPVEAAKEG